MTNAWISVIRVISNLITWGVIIHIFLRYFVGPEHPAREFTSRLFEPLLDPIRRIVPPVGMMDFSPLVLIILVQLIENLLIQVVF